MNCPYCAVAMHPDWKSGRIDPKSSKFDAEEYYGYSDGVPRPDIAWVWWAMECPTCGKTIIDVGLIDVDDPVDEFARERAYPRLAARKPVEWDVPKSFKNDYLEACNVLSISVNASAALSRRVLESILDHQGYSGGSLEQKIDSALSETSLEKVLPKSVKATIHAVRNLGNFAAHPTSDKSGLKIIDVEPEEAEWCIEIIEELFEHYYGKQADTRIAKLSEKLDDADKPNKLGENALSVG